MLCGGVRAACLNAIVGNVQCNVCTLHNWPQTHEPMECAPASRNRAAAQRQRFHLKTWKTLPWTDTKLWRVCARFRSTFSPLSNCVCLCSCARLIALYNLKYYYILKPHVHCAYVRGYWPVHNSFSVFFFFFFLYPPVMQQWTNLCRRSMTERY